MNECGRTELRVGNIEDEDEIFYLPYEFGVWWVRIASGWQMVCLLQQPTVCHFSGHVAHHLCVTCSSCRVYMLLALLFLPPPSLLGYLIEIRIIWHQFVKILKFKRHIMGSTEKTWDTLRQYQPCFRDILCLTYLWLGGYKLEQLVLFFFTGGNWSRM